MAEVVWIHGIGQQRWTSGADLQQVWVEALAHAAGVAAGWSIEDALARSVMVFYGDVFARPGAQGGDPSAGGWSDAELALAEELATTWIGRAAGSESNDRLQREGQQALADLASPPPGAEPLGLPAVVRSAVAAAARVHFFAEGGFAAAETLLWRDLKQVSSYMVGEAREEIQARAAAELMAPDVRAVVAHSLGTVVAYETIAALERPVELLVTIGSPLGLDRPIYQRLTPAAAFPGNVVRWVNVADPDDIVAAAPMLQPLFRAVDDRYVEDRAVRNKGWWRHSIDRYFQHPALVDLIGGLFR